MDQENDSSTSSDGEVDMMNPQPSTSKRRRKVRQTGLSKTHQTTSAKFSEHKSMPYQAGVREEQPNPSFGNQRSVEETTPTHTGFSPLVGTSWVNPIPSTSTQREDYKLTNFIISSSSSENTVSTNMYYPTHTQETRVPLPSSTPILSFNTSTGKFSSINSHTQTKGTKARYEMEETNKSSNVEERKMEKSSVETTSEPSQLASRIIKSPTTYNHKKLPQRHYTERECEYDWYLCQSYDINLTAHQQEIDAPEPTICEDQEASSTGFYTSKESEPHSASFSTNSCTEPVPPPGSTGFYTSKESEPHSASFSTNSCTEPVPPPGSTGFYTSKESEPHSASFSTNSCTEPVQPLGANTYLFLDVERVKMIPQESEPAPIIITKLEISLDKSIERDLYYHKHFREILFLKVHDIIQDTIYMSIDYSVPSPCIIEISILCSIVEIYTDFPPTTPGRSQYFVFPPVTAMLLPPDDTYSYTMYAISDMEGPLGQLAQFVANRMIFLSVPTQLVKGRLSLLSRELPGLPDHFLRRVSVGEPNSPQGECLKIPPKFVLSPLARNFVKCVTSVGEPTPIANSSQVDSFTIHAKFFPIKLRESFDCEDIPIAVMKEGKTIDLYCIDALSKLPETQPFLLIEKGSIEPTAPIQLKMPRKMPNHEIISLGVPMSILTPIVYILEDQEVAGTSTQGPPISGTIESVPESKATSPIVPISEDQEVAGTSTQGPPISGTIESVPESEAASPIVPISEDQEVAGTSAQGPPISGTIESVPESEPTSPIVPISENQEVAGTSAQGSPISGTIESVPESEPTSPIAPISEDQEVAGTSTQGPPISGTIESEPESEATSPIVPISEDQEVAGTSTQGPPISGAIESVPESEPTSPIPIPMPMPMPRPMLIPIPLQIPILIPIPIPILIPIPIPIPIPIVPISEDQEVAGTSTQGPPISRTIGSVPESEPTSPIVPISEDQEVAATSTQGPPISSTIESVPEPTSPIVPTSEDQEVAGTSPKGPPISRTIRSVPESESTSPIVPISEDQEVAATSTQGPPISRTIGSVPESEPTLPIVPISEDQEVAATSTQGPPISSTIESVPEPTSPIVPTSEDQEVAGTSIQGPPISRTIGSVPESEPTSPIVPISEDQEVAATSTQETPISRTIGSVPEPTSPIVPISENQEVAGTSTQGPPISRTIGSVPESEPTSPVVPISEDHNSIKRRRPTIPNQEEQEPASNEVKPSLSATASPKYPNKRRRKQKQPISAPSSPIISVGEDQGPEETIVITTSGGNSTIEMIEPTAGPSGTASPKHIKNETTRQRKRPSTVSLPQISREEGPELAGTSAVTTTDEASTKSATDSPRYSKEKRSRQNKGSSALPLPMSYMGEYQEAAETPVVPTVEQTSTVESVPEHSTSESTKCSTEKGNKQIVAVWSRIYTEPPPERSRGSYSSCQVRLTVRSPETSKIYRDCRSLRASIYEQVPSLPIISIGLGERLQGTIIISTSDGRFIVHLTEPTPSVSSYVHQLTTRVETTRSTSRSSLTQPESIRFVREAGELMAQREDDNILEELESRTPPDSSLFDRALDIKSCLVGRYSALDDIENYDGWSIVPIEAIVKFPITSYCVIIGLKKKTGFKPKPPKSPDSDEDRLVIDLDRGNTPSSSQASPHEDKDKSDTASLHRVSTGKEKKAEETELALVTSARESDMEKAYVENIIEGTKSNATKPLEFPEDHRPMPHFTILFSGVTANPGTRGATEGHGEFPTQFFYGYFTFSPVPRHLEAEELSYYEQQKKEIMEHQTGSSVHGVGSEIFQREPLGRVLDNVLKDGMNPVSDVGSQASQSTSQQLSGPSGLTEALSVADERLSAENRQEETEALRRTEGFRRINVPRIYSPMLNEGASAFENTSQPLPKASSIFKDKTIRKMYSSQHSDLPDVRPQPLPSTSQSLPACFEESKPVESPLERDQRIYQKYLENCKLLTCLYKKRNLILQLNHFFPKSDERPTDGAEEARPENTGTPEIDIESILSPGPSGNPPRRLEDLPPMEKDLISRQLEDEIAQLYVWLSEVKNKLPSREENVQGDIPVENRERLEPNASIPEGNQEPTTPIRPIALLDPQINQERLYFTIQLHMQPISFGQERYLIYFEMMAIEEYAGSEPIGRAMIEEIPNTGDRYEPDDEEGDHLCESISSPEIESAIATSDTVPTTPYLDEWMNDSFITRPPNIIRLMESLSRRPSLHSSSIEFITPSASPTISSRAVDFPEEPSDDSVFYNNSDEVLEARREEAAPAKEEEEEDEQPLDLSMESVEDERSLCL